MPKRASRKGQSVWSSGLWLAAHSLRREWRLLALVALGVLLVSLLLSAMPLLLDALSELGLAHQVRLERVDLLDIQVLASDRPTGRADYTRADGVVSRALATHLGTIQRDRIQYGKSASFFVKHQPNEQLGPGTTRANLFFLERFEEHVGLPQGRLPQSGAVSGEIEAALGVNAARSLGAQPGDLLLLAPFITEPDNVLPVRVTGLVEPRDGAEEYWLGNLLHFEAQTDPAADITTIPLYVRQESFLDVMGTRYPTVLSDYWWNVYVYPERIQARDMARLEPGLTQLRADINKGVPRSTTFTRLDDLLREHRQRVALARAPLLLLVSLLALTVAYYAALLGSLLVQRLGPDIALWKSRGARWRTLLTTFAALGLGPALAGLALGPPLALGLVALAGLLGPLRPVSGGAPLPVRWLPSSYTVAALGSGMSLAAFLAPAVMAARRTLVEARDTESRPPRQPSFLRRFLDLPVLAATAILTWQAVARGSIFGRPLQGDGVALDPVFLLLPVLLLASMLLLLARLFPLMGALLAALGNRLAAAAPTAAWRRLARNPLPYFSLAALLVLTAVLISFSATLSHSLERSYQERVLYQTGADARVLGLDRRAASDDEALRTLARAPQVSRATLVYRATARLGTAGGGEEFIVLGVDPAAFSQLAWFRPDFGAASLEDLLSPIKARPTSEAPTIPTDATSLGLWVSPERELPDSYLQVRVLGGPRGATDLDLGPVPATGWQFLRAELPPHLRDGNTLQVVSIFLVQGRYSLGPPTGSLLLDDLTALSPGEAPGWVLEAFEDVERWEVLPGHGFTPDKLEVTGERAHGGLRSLKLSWSSSVTGEPRGLIARRTPTPLPAVANPRLVGLTGLPLGQRLLASIDGVLVPVSVRAIAPLFPTIEADRQPFLAVNRQALYAYLESVPRSRAPRSAEGWLALRTGAQSEDMLATLQERWPALGRSDLVFRPQLLAEARGDPLGGTGWSGLLVLATGVAALLGTLGFAVAALAAARRSEAEFAVLRACGLSRRQLLLLILSEYVLSAGAGLLGGAALGYGIGRLVLSLLGVTERGTSVLPPIAVEVGWATVLPLLLGVLLVLTATTLVLGMASARSSIAARLRMNQ